jgi:hypothetical protein
MVVGFSGDQSQQGNEPSADFHCQQQGWQQRLQGGMRKGVIDAI